MKNLTAFIILSTLTCLTSSAQYKLLLRGQPSLFDSAVSVELTQYRALRFKLTTAEQYIASLNSEIDSLRAENNALHMLSGQLAQINEKQVQFQQVNEKSFADLNGKFNNLLTEATKPKKWYQSTWFHVTLGAAGVYILTR